MTGEVAIPEGSRHDVAGGMAKKAPQRKGTETIVRNIDHLVEIQRNTPLYQLIPVETRRRNETMTDRPPTSLGMDLVFMVQPPVVQRRTTRPNLIKITAMDASNQSRA